MRVQPGTYHPDPLIAESERRLFAPEYTDIHPPHSDPVHHPSHYTQGRIQVIEFIEDQKLGFHEGCVVQYIARAKHKGSELQDLEKAAWYLAKRIDALRKVVA